ncbi:hypothetical protein KORDIASMS9_02554 [Kordia sp. SMS9]|uniref:hypothetical protein n=1 Tax=Kordia sp. SMS9 TaxID=2282170 RepID=UPI000E0D2803|nr:hypothetical protein [Kordia sp. SMS9]AXG70315.1 hypothetical protein KORDIASMS9_02554 [Kordia sp. SMS9]
MKKQNFKNLKLNKKTISNIEDIQGGIPGLTWICTVSVSILICEDPSGLPKTGQSFCDWC